MKRLKSLMLSALALIFAAGAAQAGPYTNDGIQGFIDGAVNPVFKGWATSVVEYQPYDLQELVDYAANPWSGGNEYFNPEKALGEVTGSNVDIVSLDDMNQSEIDAWLADPDSGNGPGYITLGFDTGICNGEGYDFAVFENAFGSANSVFAELGYVEVSTNGNDFARFDAVSLTEGLVGGYGKIDPTDVHNLAGKHVNAYGDSEGTGFDLDELQDNDLVLSGLVDLNDINYIRIVDIPGSGDFTDSLGNPIYDAWHTFGSGGVDLEAIGVINTASAVPVPSALMLLAAGLAGLAGLRRKL